MFVLLWRTKVTHQINLMCRDSFRNVFSVGRQINREAQIWIFHMYYGTKPRRGRRWEDNITMDLQQMGRRDMDWIDLAQDRNRWRALLNAVITLGVS
jgi:hypothetical protein